MTNYTDCIRQLSSHSPSNRTEPDSSGCSGSQNCPSRTGAAFVALTAPDTPGPVAACSLGLARYGTSLYRGGEGGNSNDVFVASCWLVPGTIANCVQTIEHMLCADLLDLFVWHDPFRIYLAVQK